MAAVLRELRRVAASRLPILVEGPSGSGKELAARELHRLSGRGGALVAVNCATFSDSLMESEIFGHVKGAFTGAHRDRLGAIEAAEAGTLFLDEVADLSPRLQSLFLRVLQERELRRVGSCRLQRVDVRFVAASHRPLEALAEAGGFRWDLLFRLRGSVLRMPSLGARRHEFPYLLPRILAPMAREAGREPPGLEPGLAEALGGLPWPGNFRELLYSLERALLRCGAGPLGVAHFPELQDALRPRASWQEATRGFQRELLLDSLKGHQYNVAATARALGLARPALYAAARRLGVVLASERQPRPSPESFP